MSVSLFDRENVAVPLQFWYFPAGERGVKIKPSDAQRIDWVGGVTLRLDYESDQDFVDALLVANAIRYINPLIYIDLLIPYFPYARQDRLMVDGESFSLQVAVSLINLGQYRTVAVWDPHSDVLAGMFPPGQLIIKRQSALVRNIVEALIEGKTAIVSPDAGALKKIYKVSEALTKRLPVIEAGKLRDVSNGEIIKCTVSPDVADYDTLIIVDDICDGGKSFLELASAIREISDRPKLNLVTTHGIYSKGLDILEEKFYNVCCINDMSKGQDK